MTCSGKEDGMDLCGEEVEIYSSRVKVVMVMVAGEIYSNMEEVMVMVEEGSCSNKKVGEEICNSMLVVVIHKSQVSKKKCYIGLRKGEKEVQTIKKQVSAQVHWNKKMWVFF